MNQNNEITTKGLSSYIHDDRKFTKHAFWLKHSIKPVDPYSQDTIRIDQLLVSYYTDLG